VNKICCYECYRLTRADGPEILEILGVKCQSLPKLWTKYIEDTGMYTVDVPRWYKLDERLNDFGYYIIWQIENKHKETIRNNRYNLHQVIYMFMCALFVHNCYPFFPATNFDDKCDVFIAVLDDVVSFFPNDYFDKNRLQ